MQTNLPVDSAIQTFGSSSLAVECEILLGVPSLPGIALYEQNNDVLNSVTRWLNSSPLTPDEQEDIAVGTEDASIKLTAYKHVLAVRRAGRLTKNQIWLDYIQDRLFDPINTAQMATNPQWWLEVGKFLLNMQESDTKFLQDLTKAQDDAQLARARTAAIQKVAAPSGSADLETIAPHQREKMRRLMQMIEDSLGTKNSGQGS